MRRRTRARLGDGASSGAGITWQGHGLRALGGLAGGYLGGAGGSALGTSAGAAVSKIFGWGDYNIVSNSLIGTAGSGPAVFENSTYIDVVYREYVCDIFTATTAPNNSTPFSSISIPVQPALTRSFPWASQCALNYEQWEPLGLIAYFQTTCGDAGNNTQALGKVIIATEYNVNSVEPATSNFAGQPFASVMEMENSMFCSSAAGNNNIMHAIECDPSLRPTKLLYCRSTNSTGDRRLSDLCNIQIGTVGFSQANLNAGALWFSYHFRFHKPQVNGGMQGRGVLSWQYNITSNLGTRPLGIAPSSITPNPGNLTDTLIIESGGVSLQGWREIPAIDIVPDGAGNCRVYLPTWLVGGTYMMQWAWVGDANAAASGLTKMHLFPDVNGSSITLLPLVSGLVTNTPNHSSSSNLLMGTINAAGQWSWGRTIYFSINGSPPSPSGNFFSLGTTGDRPGGTNAITLLITQLNDNFVTN